jgi:hypothetical protein
VALNTSESMAQPRGSLCPRCGRQTPPVIVNEAGYCCASRGDRELIRASLLLRDDGLLWSNPETEVLRVEADALDTGKGGKRSFPWSGTEHAKRPTVPAAMVRVGGKSVEPVEDGLDIAYGGDTAEDREGAKRVLGIPQAPIR